MVGVAAGYTQNGNEFFHLSTLVLFGIFFLFSANLLVYGVNDLFDYETDKNNPKKKSYETLLEPSNRPQFINILLLVTVPFIAYGGATLAFDNLYVALSGLCAFLFFGIFYSAPPIRAKTKPFLDAFFNILYIFPGFVSYGILTDSWPSWPVIVAATAWVMAMHAFSAVPDIESDKKAGINTVATVLGCRNTILFCFVLYFVCSFTIDRLDNGNSSFGLVASYLALIYMVLMVVASRIRTEKKLFKIYMIFPYVNIAVGATIFGLILLLN